MTNNDIVSAAITIMSRLKTLQLRLAAAQQVKGTLSVHRSASKVRFIF
jgi:hypothetical protein